MTQEEKEKAVKSEVALKEEGMLGFWSENNIFTKTLEKESPKGEFIFFEGPPTANAKPALHHLISRAFKDIIPRYKTMQGFHVPRKAGWDTHGLPVELQIEKKLGLTSKKDIERYGVEAFNKACKDSVFEYISEWEKFTDRIGYWVDKKSAYYTFDTNYIESVWNILKTVNDKELLYKDYKVLPWCPRCGTALSSHELAQGYQDDKDLSVIAKFRIKGVDNGYFLAWTTTPWTLPGNVALAVGNDIDYVEVKVGNEILVLAKDLLHKVQGEYEILAEHKGSEMVGMEYEPLYPYFAEKFSSKNSEAFEKSYKVYAADFVTTTDGTGIVHTAVMYGQEDFELGTAIGLPKYHLVKEDGHFLEEMGFLSNRFVKDEEVAIDIIKDLAGRGLLFKKEKYEHSYPHCWRCKTALIYYARDSWYIRMSSLRNELVKENEGIKWEPEHIQEGRFGEWLKEIKDWAISRERYWGTPLPIWEGKEGERVILGSVADLKKHIRSNNNTYFVVRHGEAENNAQSVCSSQIDDAYKLTPKGEEQSVATAESLKAKKIDVVFVSPFIRTKRTADIIAERLGISKDDIIVDDRLRELDFGDFNGKPFQDYVDYDREHIKNFSDKLPNGESYQDAKNRMGEFLYEIDTKYADKNILLVTHGIALEVLRPAAEGMNALDSHIFLDTLDPKNGEISEFSFVPLPHNSHYEIDLHRPYIDEVELVNEKGEPLKRVKEVMDVWFDSGSMPFAQDHYPFKTQKIGYPADFISEAIDQTRGWFYTLHAIGTLMGKGKAYKNVICLGHILDKEGKKMSKSIGNILDPWDLMNTYGVDAIRLWMYTVNSPGDSKNFDEKTVDEIVKKVFNPITNIAVFYEMYKDDSIQPHDKSQHVLDRWILSRLNQVIEEGTRKLDEFKVFESARLVKDFVSDFSTWYVRRSRERFKSEDAQEKNDALSTTRFVLLELAKYMAPFTPFFAEEVYQKIKGLNDLESVHLCSWPTGGASDTELLQKMEESRRVVSSALELRQKAGHKVRQPLAKLSIPNDLSSEFLDIVMDEVNIKTVVVVAGDVKLDAELTEELKQEGIARDVIRAIQDARKKEDLFPSDRIRITICASENVKSILEAHKEMVQTPTQVDAIEYSEEKQAHEVPLEGEVVSITLQR